MGRVEGPREFRVWGLWLRIFRGVGGGGGGES